MKQEIYFVQIPDWVTSSSISDGAYRLYAVLGTFASRDKRTCYPSRSTLAERTGKTVRSVTRYLQELEDIGAIRIIRRKSEESPREWASNEYMLMVSPPASMSPPGDTGVTTPGDTGVTRVVTQMSHKPEPINHNHLNQKGSAPTGAAPAAPSAKQEPPEAEIARRAYDATDGALKFMAIKAIAKWALERKGATPQRVEQAIAALHHRGKPVTRATLDQELSGAFNRPAWGPSNTERMDEGLNMVARARRLLDSDGQELTG